MLTADLAHSRTHEETVTPLFIDADEQQYRDTAEELIQIFDEHLGEPKGELEDTIDQLTIADTDYKIVQRLAKLLKDECEFETVAPVDPREIRQALLKRANESYPIAVLNARRRQPRIFDIQSLTGSGALAVDSQIGRFDLNQIGRQPKHQFHKIPREV